MDGDVCLSGGQSTTEIYQQLQDVFFFNDILHRKSPEDESPDLFSSATMRLIFLVQSEIS